MLRIGVCPEVVFVAVGGGGTSQYAGAGSGYIEFWEWEQGGNSIELKIWGQLFAFTLTVYRMISFYLVCTRTYT